MTAGGRLRRARWLRRVTGWLGLALLAGPLLILMIVSPAAAHSVLLSSTPGEGAEVPVEPAVVMLRFSEPVGISTGSLAVLDPAGRRVEAGRPAQVPGDLAAVQVALRSGLPRASYAVLWRVISADGHPVSGGFSFGVGVPAGTTPSRVPPDALVGGLHALAWWAAYLGAVILLGVPFFALVVRPDDVREPRLHRLVRAGWQVSLASAVVLLLLQGAYGGGLGLGHVAGLDLLQQTLTGRAGLLLLLRLFVLGLAVAAGPWPGTESLGGLRRNAAGLAMLFLPTFSLLGHSGEGPLAPLAVISDSAHLAAAGVWLGGAAALLAAPPATTATASHGAARWSGVAMLAVAVLAATGTFQAWREVPAFGALPATGYGRLLLAKLAVVAVLLGLGDQGRRWLRRAGSARAWSVRRFRAVLTVELAAGATVLALTGALAGAAPASQTFDAPFSATVTARDAEGRPITLRLGVSPTRAGRQTVRLSAADAGGHARPVAAATGSLVEPARGIGPIRFAFAPDAAGRPGSQVVVVPGAGRWSLTVQVQTDPATSYSATLSYDVR